MISKRLRPRGAATGGLARPEGGYYGTVRYGMVWYAGTVRYGTVWYGMVSYPAAHRAIAVSDPSLSLLKEFSPPPNPLPWDPEAAA